MIKRPRWVDDIDAPSCPYWHKTGVEMRRDGMLYLGVKFSRGEIHESINSKVLELSPGPIWRRRDVRAVLAEALRRRILGG